jgi:hypothetical protein
MTTDKGEQKGLQSVLEERGFNVKGMIAKYKSVCPIENKDCCMAQLLSHQDDFKNRDFAVSHQFNQWLLINNGISGFRPMVATILSPL